MTAAKRAQCLANLQGRPAGKKSAAVAAHRRKMRLGPVVRNKRQQTPTPQLIATKLSVAAALADLEAGR